MSEYLETMRLSRAERRARAEEASKSCGCPQPFGPTNTDIRCHNCGEMVNVRCWKCGTIRGEGVCPNPRA